jgi:ring-1,2-phenylacetyl-CoA epoxidase subunit PaaC
MTTSPLSQPVTDALITYLVRLADDRLVIGHRLSEWCGHAPILEEDIGLANIALDNLGQANLLYELATSIEGKGTTPDERVFLRDATAYTNMQLVELPRGDFAFTIVRQFLFDAFSIHLYTALTRSTFQPLADIAAKVAKEVTYHVRHSSEWMLRLGDGTEESHARAQAALDELWLYTDEPFIADNVDAILGNAGIAAHLTILREQWDATVREIVTAATLDIPTTVTPLTLAGRKGIHTEHLGHMLAEMQILQRSYPGASW